MKPEPTVDWLRPFFRIMRICSRSPLAAEYSCWAALEGVGRAVVVSVSPGPGAGGVVAGGVAGGITSGGWGAARLAATAPVWAWPRCAPAAPKAAAQAKTSMAARRG